MRNQFWNRWQRMGLSVIGVVAVIWAGTRYLSRNEMPGFLKVLAPSNGTYEVYRIESEVPLQFVSEQIGKFNEDLPLPPGSYLLLGDCSSKTVIIRPGKTETVVSNEVSFAPPHNPTAQDKFSIQCNRYAETHSRQHFTNRYTLNILEGKRELLVGMVPLHIDFEANGGNTQPRQISYKLSALQVSAFDGMKPRTSFFTSPVGGMIAITESQEFGHWQFLLPGTYKVEVNGTQMQVDLLEGEVRTITPAFLKVSAPSGTDLELSSQIRGNPIYVELNQDHWLDLGEVYPVLPGKATIKVNGSTEPFEIVLTEGELIEKMARSILIHSDCSPFEWACLGNTTAFLYEEGRLYPFLEGVTDVPMLFFKETDVWVGVQGSRDIRYKISAKQQSAELNLGKVHFIPTYDFKQGQVTDLARLEAISPPYSGETLDIQLDRETEMPVIAGTYFFTEYITLTHTDGDRRRKRQFVTVRAHKTVEIPFTAFVPEKKLAQLEAEKKKNQAAQEKKEVRRYSSRFHEVIPPKYQ